MGPLMRDLSTAYTACSQHETPKWPALDAQYSDYTLMASRGLRTRGRSDKPDSPAVGRGSGSHALAGLPQESPCRRTVRDQPAEPSRRRGRVQAEQRCSSRTGSAWPGSRRDAAYRDASWVCDTADATRRGTDIPIGTPVAGRGDRSLDDLVGFFVNTLVLRADTSRDPSFRELIRRLRAVAVAGYAHQDI